MNRTLAHFFSTIGHPLLGLSYVLVLMLMINPYAFGVNSLNDNKAVLLFLVVFATTFLLPGIGIALMKPLGLVRSLSMPDRQERIGPYIITGVFYLWLYKNLISNSHTPPLYTAIVLGSTIGLFVNFFLNIFFKISAHAAGMGGFLTSVVLIAFTWPSAWLNVTAFGGLIQINLFWVIIATLLLAGGVGSSRLALKAHTPYELYRGYLAGMGAVLLGWLLA